MWLTGDIQIPIATQIPITTRYWHAQGTRGQAVSERTKELENFSSGSILKISLADLSCNSLYEDDHYLLEHILNWNTANQFHQPDDNSDNSQHHDCQFCPGSPRRGVTTAMDQRIQAAVQQHRPTAGPSSVSPSVPPSIPTISASGSGTSHLRPCCQHRNGRYVKYLTSTCSPRIH